MNAQAQQLLKQLCAQYDKLSQQHQSRPFPEFSETIQTTYGHCFVHCSIGAQRFSIVSVNFSPEVRGQGVLTAFIDYIKRNPYQYSGVEVAVIQNKGLARHLIELGWEYKSWFTKMFFSHRPSLVQNF